MSGTFSDLKRFLTLSIHPLSIHSQRTDLDHGGFPQRPSLLRLLIAQQRLHLAEQRPVPFVLGVGGELHRRAQVAQHRSGAFLLVQPVQAHRRERPLQHQALFGSLLRWLDLRTEED